MHFVQRHAVLNGRRRRAQVREWQHRQRRMAIDKGYVRTLLGRQRLLPDAQARGAAQVREP